MSSPRLPKAGALCAVVLLVACSGQQTVPAPRVPSVVGKAASVVLRLRVPLVAASSSARSSKYISAGTKSVSLKIVAYTTGAPQVLTVAFNVMPSSPNCKTTSSAVQCTEIVDAPIGLDYFTIAAFDAPLASAGGTQGNQLSSGTTSSTIVEGAANTVALTLAGTPAVVNMTLGNASPPQGTTTTTPLTLDVRDADGYAIVGSYSAQIELNASNSYSTTFQVDGGAATYVGGSTDTVTITYNGQGSEAQTIQAVLLGQTTPLGSVAFTPQPAFGTETAVGASLTGGSVASNGTTIEFTEPSNSRVATLSPGTGLQYYPVASGAQPLRIFAFFFDMYFTESNNSIGASTKYGMREIPLPTANAGLYSIGASWSYDFSVWFTEKNAGQLGRIDTTSYVTGTLYKIDEFPIGVPHSAPAGITNAFSGFAFADPGTNAIGTFDPATHAIKEYPVPSAGANPLEISSTGATGNPYCWFTEPGVSKIGRMDSSGHIAEFPSAGVPVAIAATLTSTFVLTSTGIIERYDPSTGGSTSYVPPASANGPIVGMAWDGAFALDLLRSTGSIGSVQLMYI